MKKYIVWYIFAIFQLDIYELPFSTYSKWLSIFTVVLFIVTSVHTILANSIAMHALNLKHGMLNIFIILQCLIIWVLFYMRKKKIRKNLFHLLRYKKYFKINRNRIFTVIINMSGITFLVLPWLTTISACISDNQVQKIAWLYSLEVHDETLINCVSFCSKLLYSVFFVSFPAFCTLSSIVVFYESAEVLKFYNSLLRDYIGGRNCNGNWDFLEEYLCIRSILIEMNENFSFPSFMIIAVCFEYILITLFEYSYKDNTFQTYAIFHFIYGFAMFTSLSYFGSLIPENLNVIRATAEKLIDRFCSVHCKYKIISSLKRIETKDAIYISPCAMFNLTKTFILSATGTIITYVLLIYNLSI